MDSVSSYKKKLASFRIKELKDVLRQLGVSRQGKKQELVDRIEAFLLKEVSNAEDSTKKNFIVRGVAAIIDDVYRELQGAGLTSASMNGENFVEINNMKPKEEVVDKKVRCPCGSSLATDYMIQCSDRQCLVLQHICCVVIPEEGYSEAIPPLPSQFYCEICRINRADPFWVTVAYPLSPVKLIASNNPADGTNPLQSVEGTFQLTAADIDLLQNMEYDVQAWCILLNDKVPFRMQWPLYADLKVNGVPVKTMSRPGSHLLGANGRDDGPMIAFYIGEEINRISLSGCDARSFCLGVRLVKRRTIEQILNLILDEQNAEPLEDALVRVRCCIGGGMATAYEDSDSDSDLEVIADCVTVNLRCPMSGSRIKTAGRFRSCVHMGCFDLETFVQINQRSRKWQCPICLKNYSLEDITIDPYFNRITKMVQDCGEDLTEIDVKPDGSWRLKNGCQFKYLEQWHLPDGSLCDSTLGIGLNLEASKHLKEEGIVGHITPKQLSKPRDTQITSRNQLGEYFEKCSPTIITMSSSSSQSHRDDEVCSVNQVGFGNFDKAANNNHEVNTISLGSMNVIVLSDSEEENANLTTVETPCITRAVDNGGHSFPAPPAFANVYAEDPVLHARASSLGLVNSNDNDFEISRQAFDSDNVSGTLIHSEFTPFSSSAPVDGYIVPSKCTIDSDRKVFGSSMCHSNTKINDSLVINPLAFVCADPHVQTLPPTQSSGQIMHFDQGIDHLTSNGTCGESLGGNSGVGNGVAGIHAKPATSNGLDLVNQLESNKGLLLPSMNDEVRSNGTTNRKRSYGPFSFPRQPRSAIPRQPRSARRPRLS